MPSSVKLLMGGVDKMCKAELVMECEKLGIDADGSVAHLRYVVKKYYEEHGAPEMDTKKVKVDPLSKKATAAAVAPTPPPTPAGPPTCPKGAACDELHFISHRTAFAHAGFRPNPIKCRDGLGCTLLKDRTHLVKYAHEDDVAKMCPDGINCDKLHLMDHRLKLEHPGFRAQPVKCRDGLSCARLTDKGHLYKYAHDDDGAAPAAVTPAVSSVVAPAAAKPAAPASVVTSPVKAPSGAASVSGGSVDVKALIAGKTLSDIPLDTAPESVLVEIDKDSEEFWELEEKFNANLQTSNEDYVAKRIKAGKKPLRFLLIGAERVINPVLEARYELKKQELLASRGPKECRERVSFHGTHPKNLKSILRYSLLRFKHPLNPCKTQVDDGYFGTNKSGIYVSRYADYTLKYSNRVCAVDPGDEVKTIMFRTLPGKSKHIEKLVGAIDPTPGFDSHSSPTFLEWYLFDEAQVCPQYVLKIRAVEDTRTAADDQ